MGYAAFWFAVLQIIFINLLLSGDNAVVIAMACRGLPPQQRRWGMIIGAGVAVILRIVFIGIIARLMLLPYLKLVGGVALLFIAAKLIVPEDRIATKSEAVAHLWRAVMIIAIADIVMSLDNVIAIAAIAQGNFLLLAIGLAVSIPLIMAGAALVHGAARPFSDSGLGRRGAARLGRGRSHCDRSGVVATSGGEIRRTTCRSKSNSRRPRTGAALAIGAGGLWRRLHEGNAGASARQTRGA